MTIKAEPIQSVRSQAGARLSGFHLTKTTRASAKVGGMQSRTQYDLRTAATEGDSEYARDTELEF